MKTILVAAMMFILIGCEKDKDEPDPPPNWVAQVTTNTSWSGYFGNRTVEGHGSQLVDLPDEEIVCVSVQKQTDGTASLSLQIKAPNRDWNRPVVTTTAPYGIVSDCNQ